MGEGGGAITAESPTVIGSFDQYFIKAETLSKAVTAASLS